MDEPDQSRAIWQTKLFLCDENGVRNGVAGLPEGAQVEQNE